MSSIRGVKLFTNKGKISPIDSSPFKILECIGHVAYRPKLPKQLAGVHDVLHVFIISIQTLTGFVLTTYKDNGGKVSKAMMKRNKVIQAMGVGFYQLDKESR